MSKIMGISRLRTGTDGKGITTLVTFYKCPLKCTYCINNHCHKESGRSSDYTDIELLEIVKVDDIYFRMSGGGVTFGGGEPLLQTKFIERFVKKAPAEWNIRIETSLNVSWKAIEPLIPYVDQWIIDIKDMNDDIYKKYTGISNAKMKYNLFRLTEQVPDEKIHIRIPNIRGYNTNDDVKKSLEELDFIDCKKEVFDYVYVDTSIEW